MYVRGDGGLFEEFQRIPTQGALDWEFFTVDGAHYLAVANQQGSIVNYNFDSVIYRQRQKKFRFWSFLFSVCQMREIAIFAPQFLKELWHSTSQP